MVQEVGLADHGGLTRGRGPFYKTVDEAAQMTEKAIENLPDVPAIDQETESIFPLTEVPARLEPQIGKLMATTTVRLWPRKGLSGVVLATCYRSGLLHTSNEALKRFDVAVTKVRQTRLAKKRADRALAESAAE